MVITLLETLIRLAAATSGKGDLFLESHPLKLPAIRKKAKAVLVVRENKLLIKFACRQVALKWPSRLSMVYDIFLAAGIKSLEWQLYSEWLLPVQ